MLGITTQQAKEYLADYGNNGPVLKDQEGDEYDWTPYAEPPFYERKKGEEFWTGVGNSPSQKYLCLFVESRNKMLEKVLKERKKDLERFGNPSLLEIKGQGSLGVHLGFKGESRIIAVFYLDDGGLQVEGDHPDGLFQD